MLRKLFSILFVTILMSGNGTGLSGAFAQSQSGNVTKLELEAAIEAYQTGSQGDVIRYLMQRGYEGNVAAQFNVGVINYQREDKAVGLKEAQFWFGEAAEEGDLIAQMNLGMLKINDGLTTEDIELLEEGARWLRRSAESGYRPAQVNLGGLIVLGKLVSPYPGEGKAWLKVASEAGDPRASRLLQVVAESATVDDFQALIYPVEEQLRSAPYRGGSKVKTANAPVYAEPTSELQPIATLGADTLVEVLDRSGEWVSVKIPAGLPVWISANVVKLESDLVRVNRLEATLYSAPDGDAEAFGLGTVTKGETLQLMESQGEWLMVRSPARFAGWMKFSDVVSKTGLTVAQDVDSQIENPDNDEIAGTPDVFATAVMVSDAELLQLPDRDSALLGVVASDAEITIMENAEDFVFAEVVQVTGWVSKALLNISESTGADQLIATVNTRVARVRSRPSLDSTGFGRLLRNEQVNVIEQQDGWVRIELGSGSGWIVSQLVNQSGALKAEEVVSLDSTQSTTQKQAAVEQVAEQSDEPVTKMTGSSAVNSSQKNADTKVEAKLRYIKQDAVLYSTGSTNSQPLGRVASPLVVQNTDGMNMIRVDTLAPIYGWVFAILTKANGGQVEITTNGVRIRLDPTTERDNIVGARNRGASLTLLERQGSWLKIAIDPANGWVLATDVE